ncbi:MAG TPA: hypothetical protein VII13_05425 [Vicinamibacteria bacterium]
MSRRLLAGLGLFLLALAVHFALARPWRRSAVAAGAEEGRLRDERREVAHKRAALEKREAVRLRAAVPIAAREPGELVRAVRRSLVESLEGAGARGVRLGVRPGRHAAAAAVSLAAEADFEEVMRLSGHLVRPGSGLVLERVRFSPRPGGVGLDVEAVGVGSS